MSSDKNIKDLGYFLKVLQQPIRRDILNKLNLHENPLSFSTLQKEVLSTISNSVNFSFHLKPLKSLSLISSKEGGYTITNLGRQILNSILNMEQVLNESKNPIMIRTSKYSKEKFDINKIGEYLIKEGELKSSLAEKIANLVKERLKTIKIDYLTAPLMREYINAILIENNLEEVRHRLTRLGTPPYEVSKYFKRKDINPLDLIHILGSDASEQYLLLNLLPKNFADMYLSGEVIVLHLNQWALMPQSAFIHTETILERLYKNNSALPRDIRNMRELISLVLKFFDFLKVFRPFFSEDILIGEFNTRFLSYFNCLKNQKRSLIHNIIASQFSGYSEFFRDDKPHITLEFSYKNDGYLKDEIYSLFQTDELFLKNFRNGKYLNRNIIMPLILLDYFNLYTLTSGESIFNELFSPTHLENIIFYDNNTSNLLNSAIIKVKSHDFSENRIILDKILINLHLIALKANQNDELFYSLLQDKLNSVFEFFDYKEALVTKKLHHINNWKFIITEILEKKLDEWNMDSLKSVSFFGLNEAIKHHCGLELDRIEKSEVFALNVLKFLKNLIREKNETENNNYNLSQPCDVKFLNGTNSIRIPDKYKNLNPLKIIKNDSNLSLDKKLSLFKKFETTLDGGSLFSLVLDSNQFLNEENLSSLFESNLQAFNITY